MPKQHYRGRFAPTPSGPLHFGSLVAATASYLDAKSHQGSWLLRIDDLDKPRVQIGAIQSIIHTLETYGFKWDEEILYQSQRSSAYQNTLDELILQKKAYFCGCSKKRVQQTATMMGESGPIYFGTCRNRFSRDMSTPMSVRVLTDDKMISFEDRIQGFQQQQIESEVGDFILKRSDGIYAYQLATVVDDAHQNITDVVRGIDLLDNTARQLYLQKLLACSDVAYLHFPIVTNSEGNKLSKQNHAAAILANDSFKNVYQSLIFLGQQPPEENEFDNIDDLWSWAINNWDINKILSMYSKESLNVST